MSLYSVVVTIVFFAVYIAQPGRHFWRALLVALLWPLAAVAVLVALLVTVVVMAVKTRKQRA